MYLKVQTNKLHTTTKEAPNEFKLNKIYKCHTLGPLAPSFTYQILSPLLKLHLRHKSCTLPTVLAPPLLKGIT